MIGAMIDLRNEARAHMPALDADLALYPAARETWRGRMVNEYLSATVFEGLAEQILEADLDPDLAAQCHRFAAEERRHGILCGAVVEALEGEALAARPEREPYPRHEDATPIEALLRNLLSICCMAETVAVALVGAERLEMPEGELRALLTRIYADEVGHARFGWDLLAKLAPRLSDEERSRLDRYLVLALAHLEAHELAHIPTGRHPDEGAKLGLCSGDDARLLLYETIDEVILPGLESAGFRARAAWQARGSQQHGPTRNGGAPAFNAGRGASMA